MEFSVPGRAVHRPARYPALENRIGLAAPSRTHGGEVAGSGVVYGMGWQKLGRMGNTAAQCRLNLSRVLNWL